MSPNIQKLEKKGKLNGLLKALNHKKSDVRYEAVKALGNIGDPIAVDNIILVLNDNDFCVREEVIVSLGMIGDEKAIYPLIQKLNEAPFKDIIIDTLTKFNHTVVIRHLINVLGNPSLWEGVLETLTLFGSASFEVLVQDLSAQDARVRRAITKVLGYLGDMRAADFLVSLFKDDNDQVRLEATMALDMLSWEPKNDLEKVQYLFIKEQWNELVKVGPLALDILISALRNTKKTIRENACRSLGEIRDPRAIEPLVEMLRDEKQDMRLEAIIGLEKLGWQPRTESEQLDILIIKEQWTQLVTIGSPAVPRLIEMLNDQNFNIRKNTVWTLGEIKDPDVIPPLIKVLNNPNLGIQTEAAKALKNHYWCPSSDIKGVWEARLSYTINECWRKAIPTSSAVAIASKDEKIFILPEYKRALLQVYNYNGIQISEFKTIKGNLKVSPDGARILVGRTLYDHLGKRWNRYGNKAGILNSSHNVDMFAGFDINKRVNVWNLRGKRVNRYAPLDIDLPSGFSIGNIEKQIMAISPDSSFQVVYMKADAIKSNSGAMKAGFLLGGIVGAAIGSAISSKKRMEINTYGIWTRGELNKFSREPPQFADQIHISNENIIIYVNNEVFIYSHHGHFINKSANIGNIQIIAPSLDGKVVFWHKRGSFYVFDINSTIETKLLINPGKTFAINENGDKLAVIEHKGQEDELVLYDIDLYWEMKII